MHCKLVRQSFGCNPAPECKFPARAAIVAGPINMVCGARAKFVAIADACGFLALETA